MCSNLSFPFRETVPLIIAKFFICIHFRVEFINPHRPTRVLYTIFAISATKNMAVGFVWGYCEDLSKPACTGTLLLSRDIVEVGRGNGV